MLMAGRIPADGKRGSQPAGATYPTPAGTDALRRLSRACLDRRSIVPQQQCPLSKTKSQNSFGASARNWTAQLAEKQHMSRI
jgi:hypothetical protein